MQRFESYLRDVEERLAKVPQSRKDEILAELRAHLILSQRAAVEELGMEDAEAMEIAISGLGHSAIVADELVLRERGFSTKPAWKLAFTALILDAMLHFVLPLILTVYPETYRSATLFLEVQDLSFLVLAAFVWAVVRSRRWLVWPMVASFAAWSLVTAIIVASPPFKAMVERSIRAAGQDPTGALHRAGIDADIALARLGAKGLMTQPEKYHRYGAESYTAPGLVVNSYKYQMPYLPVSFTARVDSALALTTFPDKEDAAEAWRKNGAAFLTHMEREKAEAVQTPTVSAVLQHQLGFAAISGVARIVPLVAVNGLILSLYARKRRRIKGGPSLA